MNKDRKWNGNQMEFNPIPADPNFSMEMGDPPIMFILSFVVKRTFLNRIKYWMFFRFFPFRLVRWERERE